MLSRKEHTKEHTQELVLNTATKLFCSLGYAGTTTSLIAAQAGISEATIFKHFQSKDNLLHQIGSSAVCQISDWFSCEPLQLALNSSQSDSLRPFIESLLLERLHFIDEHFEPVKLLLIEMQYSPAMKEKFTKHLLPKIYEHFSQVRHLLMARAPITEDQAEAIIRLLGGLVVTFILQKYLFDITLTDEDIRNQMDYSLNLLEESIIHH